VKMRHRVAGIESLQAAACQRLSNRVSYKESMLAYKLYMLNNDYVVYYNWFS
jgi:hypothetical protein